MALSHEDWELQNSRIWLAKIDIVDTRKGYVALTTYGRVALILRTNRVIECDDVKCWCFNPYTMWALALQMEMGPQKDRGKLWPGWELNPRPSGLIAAAPLTELQDQTTFGFDHRCSTDWATRSCPSVGLTLLLLRKRQRMHDRKLIGSRQRSLHPLILPLRERPLLAGNDDPGRWIFVLEVSRHVMATLEFCKISKT